MKQMQQALFALGYFSHKIPPSYSITAVQEIDGARFVVAGLNTVLQIGRYVDEHEKLFGKYKYGLPPKPTDDMMSELNVTFLEWLESKGLYALMPFFVYSQAAQGYGSLEKVPALYGAPSAHVLSLIHI